MIYSSENEYLIKKFGVEKASNMLFDAGFPATFNSASFCIAFDASGASAVTEIPQCGQMENLMPS